MRKMLSIGKYPVSLALWKESKRYYDIGVGTTSYCVSITLWKINVNLRINITRKLVKG